MTLSSLENFFVNTSFALLLTSLITYWTSIIFTQLKALSVTGRIATILVNLSLAAALGIRWISHKYFPLSNLYESLIFLSWSFTSVHLILEYQNKSKLIGCISAPISLFTVAFASLSLPLDMQKAAPLVPALRSNWLMMHVSVMIISYSTLILGCLLSVLFLIISKGKNVNLKGNSYSYSIKNTKINYSTELSVQMETNHSSAIELSTSRMSLLQSIDNLSYRIIGLGFPLLTIGIIAGAIWANEAWGSYWSWDPKETWALITWLIFAAYLHARLTKSWQGKKPAILATIGFVIVWICYLGVNFIGKGLHSYGWIS
uniref:Cytochrome c biogenesis protein CcsA n=1 Tax=Rhodymenia pseudopalmata TaxID=31502 RepID=A0A1C9C7J7_RHOPU|nr:cytochrome c biogenesis protein [Rhodymenia pseudopalmata]AOM64358.1 cytochrome c biogenesis protein [Rhodymenia pseudopalmata]